MARSALLLFECSRAIDRFEQIEGGGIAANFGAIEKFADSCANPIGSVPASKQLQNNTIK